MNEWETVVGLEIHVHLKTRTKMFCRCATGFGDPENTRTCPICLAHPGALPVANRLAIEWTVKLGLALGCRAAERAVFHRKQYWYPDLPKGYQISQYDEPLCIGGRVAVPRDGGDTAVGIVRVHLEEDAAKSVHVGGAAGRIVGAEATLVDFNRGGTPLVEIVTEPDLRSADEARRFLQLLRQSIVELGISDAEMEKGTLRCDANVSVREVGETGLRTRWEIKNMNSFSFIGRGIEAATREQIALHEAGATVAQATYDYDADSDSLREQIALHEAGATVAQATYDYDADSDSLTPHRSKEEADDYRYFPEPDLVPVEPSDELVERLRGELPELPAARIRRLEQEVGFELAEGLVTSGRDRLYERVTGDRRAVANVVMNQLAGAGIDPEAVNPVELGRLIDARERIPRTAFDEAISNAGAPGFTADAYLAHEAVSDAAELDPVIEAILAANPGQVDAYRGGKDGLLGFFVGQVMKATEGKANPKVVNERLREKLRA